MIQLIRNNPLFVRFWIGAWFSELGDWLRNMAVMYIVLDLFPGSAVALSATMFAEYAPIFLFGPFIGVIADRWHRKRTIANANIFRAAIMLVFFVGVRLELLWVIIGAAFLSSVATLFFRAPGNAFMMQFVPEQDRRTAASLRQLSISSMLMLGPIVGTTLYTMVGGSWTFILAVVLFLISAALIYSVKVKEVVIEMNSNADEAHGAKGFQTIWRDLKEGMRYAFQHPVVRPILIGATFVGFGGGMINVLEVFILTDYMGLPKTMMAYLATVQGIGMLLSTFLVQLVKLRTDRYISIGMMVMGAGFCTMVLYPVFGFAAGGLIVFSVGQISLNIGMATLMQTKVEYAFQGRVNMTFQTAMMGFMTFALLITGGLYRWIPIQELVLAGGFLVTCGGLICFLLFRRVPSTLLREAEVPQGVVS